MSTKAKLLSVFGILLVFMIVLIYNSINSLSILEGNVEELTQKKILKNCLD